ncbi:MAG: hypothetical protein ACI93R_002722 [Flavobacteriales bacterium]|jgi:hypothetical protein
MIFARSLKRSLSALFFLVVSPLVVAQAEMTPEEQLEEAFKSWYQIEVIIFEHIKRPMAEDEHLSKNLDFLYPARLEFLQTEDEWLTGQDRRLNPENYDIDGNLSLNDPNLDVSLNRSDNTLEGTLNRTLNTSEGTLDIDQGNTSPSSETDTTLAASQDIDATQNGINDNASLINTEANSQANSQANTRPGIAPNLEPNLEPTRDQEFIKLDKSHKSLLTERKRLDRSRGYRVLMHETWRQELHDKNEADSIFISGGEHYGEHFELEGSIELSLSRYLHITSNLWLTHFEDNYGQESEHWPNLPSLPKKTPLFIRPEAIQPALDAEKPFELTLGVSTPFSFDLSAGQLGTNAQDLNLIQPSSFGIGTQLFEERAPYVIKEIAKLSAKRRMRSNELHHIDHPRLGILIQIQKYTPALIPAPLSEP